VVRCFPIRGDVSRQLEKLGPASLLRSACVLVASVAASHESHPSRGGVSHALQTHKWLLKRLLKGLFSQSVLTVCSHYLATCRHLTMIGLPALVLTALLVLSSGTQMSQASNIPGHHRKLTEEAVERISGGHQRPGHRPKTCAVTLIACSTPSMALTGHPCLLPIPNMAETYPSPCSPQVQPHPR
jgi:hypothetical protein